MDIEAKMRNAMNDTEQKMVIDELEKSGFPFERTIRKKLTACGINTTPSRYMVKMKDGSGEVSKDIDALGNVKFETFETADKAMYPNLQLRLVGEVKKWSGAKICFYEMDNENPDNFLVSFPNFLNHCNHFISSLAGGHTTLSEFYKEFGNASFSKTVCYLQEKKDQSGKRTGYGNNGNAPIFDASSDLTLACEYFHRRELINNSVSFKIHGCFPIIFTEAEIFKITGEEKLSLTSVNYFIYLVACSDLDKVPLTTKEKYYLPILITNADITSAIELVKKISNLFYADVENLVNNRPDLLKAEYEDYKKLVKHNAR